jgi:hypothetical protein
MALNKQEVSLPLSMGIDTKSDEKQQPPGTLHVLENAVFDEPGKLKKRNGYEKVNLKDTTGSTITAPLQLAAYKEELLLFNKNSTHSYASTIDQWSNKGSSFTIIPESTKVLQNNVEQSELDSTHASGLDIFVFKDSSGVHLSVMDNNTKAFLIKKQTLSATGTNPKVVNRDNTIYMFYTESNTIKWQKFNIFDFNNITTATTVVTAQNSIFDIQLVDDRIQIAYNSTTASGTLTLQSLKMDDTLSTSTEVTGEFASVAVSLETDTTSRTLVSYYDGSDVKVVAYNYNLGAKLITETSIETIADVKNVAIIQSSTDTYTIVYEVGATESYNHYIKKNTITLAASVGTPSVLLRGLALASKLWCHDNVYYFTALHDNTLQSTLFVSDISGSIVSKISPNVAGDLITNGTLPRISPISSTEYLLASQVKGRLTQDNGTFFSILGVNSTVLDFSTESKFDSAPLGQNLHISGGFLKMYDGASITEHNFHLFPEGLADGGTSASGGVLSDGAYAYKAVYAWTDAQGIIHRSAPSLAFNVTLSGGGAAQQQTITVPTLRLTEKEDVIIELYRTEASGTVYYLVSSTSAPTANDKTVDSINMVDDNISDSDLISREALYTTGGVLDNLPAPPSSIIESFKNRIFTTTPESGKLNYSKIQNEGFPVEFNDALEIQHPDKGGDNVALRAMDDKLIILKKNALYFLSGDGPNNLGEQDNFIEPELISSEIGCVSRFSIVLTPLGLFFESNKGIYLLTNSLQLVYIGAPVEDYNNLTITSAVVVADKNQVRFTTSDGDTLVYNYVQNKWTTFTNHRAISAILLDNVYYYLRPDSLLYKENTSYQDNGTSIKLKLESGWISLAGVQNFKRVYKMLLLGEFKSVHKLRIKVAYDFVDAWVHEKIIDTADFINSNAYGETSPYGAESTYGAANLHQIRVDMERQKCQSIKISIEDLQDGTGEALELSNILFVIGVKGTEGKISQDRTYGTSS